MPHMIAAPILALLIALVGAYSNRTLTGRPAADPDCRARCATQCERLSCSGLNVSQCLSQRQSCRVSCSSRC